MGCFELWGNLFLEISEKHPESILIEFQITKDNIGNFKSGKKPSTKKLQLICLDFFLSMICGITVKDQKFKCKDDKRIVSVTEFVAFMCILKTDFQSCI